MKNQEKIFVIGHKNPDTDSICSAIAYCDIKNRTSQHQKFIPKRAGQINEETEYVLNRFGVQPPGYLSNIGTQVKDMDIRMSPDADKGMSLKAAWDIMQENSIVSLPIRDKEGALEGLITILYGYYRQLPSFQSKNTVSEDRRDDRRRSDRGKSSWIFYQGKSYGRNCQPG